jgi:predicted secreted hydrolase
MNNYHIACLCLLCTGCGDATSEHPMEPLTVAAMLGETGQAGFKRAVAVREFHFPEDHGSHPEYRTEWWYFTGNVSTAGGRQFGYQFTLFRNAIAPPAAGAADMTQPAASNWSTNQLYMAHAALSDIETGEFYHDEQFSRGALGLAGVETRPLRFWLHQWTVAALDQRCPDCFTVEVAVAARDFRLRLQLENTRPPVLHGRQGLSAKSAVPGNASYYYSYTRLHARGQISLGAADFAVAGEGWFDHEWSTSALERGQAGWDWFALQIPNQAEIMLYRIRHQSDPNQHYVSGTLVQADGAVRALDGAAVTIQQAEVWRSDLTGVTYPSVWNITLPGMRLRVTPKMPNQEINRSFRYWEGAVQVSGEASGRALTGRGYVELTGYR